MRIALINSVAGYGSTGRIVDQLAHLPDTQARIYYGRKQALTDADTYRITGFSGNAAHAMKTFLADAQGFASAKETERMVVDLRSFAPDLIHLHNLHGYYLNIEVLFRYLKETGIPVIWTMHDCWAFTGHCAHYESVGCDQWKNGCRICPALRHYPMTFNGGHVKDNYLRKKEIFTSLPVSQLTIVTPSQWLKEQLSQSFLKDYEVIHIPNGIDLSRFQPQERTGSDVFRMLAVAGVWSREKGWNDLKTIAGMLKDDETLTVVGVSTKQKKELQGLHVNCIEHTDSVEDLAELYSEADVLLNPTYEDTFPTVNIEAQACGCPVITYRTGGSPEMLTEKTGIVVKRGDVTAMYHAAESVKEKDIILNREDAVINAAKYTKENMLEAYHALYLQNDTHEKERQYGYENLLDQ